MAIVTGGFDRGRRGRGAPPLADINVTPFVDVALVLLIIFMITAHVMEYGIEINVPKTRTVAAATKERPVITISKAGEMYLGKDTVNINRIVTDLRAKYPGQDTVYLRADAATQWDIVANVMSVLGTAKIGIAAVTQPNGKP